jgi:hypothetical protein
LDGEFDDAVCPALGDVHRERTVTTTLSELTGRS